MHKLFFITISIVYSVIAQEPDWSKLDWSTNQFDILKGDVRQQHKLENLVEKNQANIDAQIDYQHSLRKSNKIIFFGGGVEHMGKAAELTEKILIDRSPLPPPLKSITKKLFEVQCNNFKDETYKDLNNSRYIKDPIAEMTKPQDLLNEVKGVERYAPIFEKNLNTAKYTIDAIKIGKDVYNDANQIYRQEKIAQDINKNIVDLEKNQQKDIDRLNAINKRLQEQNNVYERETTFDLDESRIRNNYRQPKEYVPQKTTFDSDELRLRTTYGQSKDYVPKEYVPQKTTFDSDELRIRTTYGQSKDYVPQKTTFDSDELRLRTTYVPSKSYEPYIPPKSYEPYKAPKSYEPYIPPKSYEPYKAPKSYNYNNSTNNYNRKW